MSIGERQQQILASIEPSLGGIMEFGPLMNDREACDFVARNPEVPALPGYVETLQKWLEPQHRRWFAYGLPDPRASQAAAQALSDELEISFESDDIILTRGAHGAMTLAMAMVVDPGDEGPVREPAVVLLRGDDPRRERDTRAGPR